MKIIMQLKLKSSYSSFFSQALLTFFIFNSPSFTSGSNHSCVLWFVGNCRTSFVLSSAHGIWRQYFHALLVLSLFGDVNNIPNMFKWCDARNGCNYVKIKVINQCAENGPSFLSAVHVMTARQGKEARGHLCFICSYICWVGPQITLFLA